MTKSFNLLLRETLKAPAQEPADGCLDAGVLAAWFEGTLDPGARAAAEAHAADCARCQAVLAAMIRIEPPIESRPWWRSPAFGWLVPITVAAAALVIFLRPSGDRMVPEVAVQPASPAMTKPAEQAPAPPAAQTRTAAVDSFAAAKATPAPSPTQAGGREGAKQEALAKRQNEARAEAPAAPTIAPVSVDTAPLKDRVGVRVDESTLQRAASAAADSAAPATERGRKSVAAAGTPSVAAAAPAEVRSTQAAEKGVAESVMLQARSVSAAEQREIVIQGPGGSSRWRITTPGSVQRSADAGTTWETQTTGVRTVITNGAAPSNSVCWLVGKGGVVVLSVDGRTWRQVSFPQAVDLVSVKAADGNNATVAAADGRTFRTTDGGKSWK